MSSLCDNAPVTFERFCSVVRSRADLTPVVAVSKIATLLNVNVYGSAMLALCKLLRSDALLSDENLRPIYSQLYGDSSMTANSGSYANTQPQTSRPCQPSAQPSDLINRLDKNSITFDEFAQAIRNILAEDKYGDVKINHLLDLGLSAQLPHWQILISKMNYGGPVDTVLLQSLFREFTGRHAPSTSQSQASRSYQPQSQSLVSGVVEVEKEKVSRCVPASGFERFCQVVRQYAHKKPDESIRMIASTLNVNPDSMPMKKIRKILSVTRDPSDEELRPVFGMLNMPNGKAGEPYAPSKKMNNAEAEKYLGMTEIEF